MKIIMLLMALLAFVFGAQAQTQQPLPHPDPVLSSESLGLNDDNTVVLKDVVRSSSITQVIKELAARENNEEPVIYLVLDTPGGSVFAGINLIQYLKGYKKPVKTITIFAASMGFQIAEGNPGERLILDTGVLMSHPMSGGIGGELGTGFSADNQHGFIKEIIETMDKQVVSRTNGKVSLEEYKKAYDNELWTTGQNAVDKGYADSVTKVGCTDQLSSSVDVVDEREFLGFAGFAGPISLEIKYETSRCPLMMSLLRYQVAFVLAASEKRIVIVNNGYTIESQKSQSFDEFIGSKSRAEADELRAKLESSMRYKSFMFYLNRDINNVGKISWL